MKVRATELGYYNHKRRRQGEVFVLRPYKRTVEKFDDKTKKVTKEIVEVPAADQFSRDWMELADNDAKVVASKPQKKFGKGFQADDSHMLRPARPVHEAPPDEEALAAEDELIADDEETSEQDVL